jgi:hypothetical protein
MPYQHYRNMSDEDLASVVVYLRSLPAVDNQLPATEIIFPVRYLIRSAPEPIAAPVADVVFSDQLKYGTHLADQAGCIDCHTPQVRGQNVSGMDFAGGFPFTGPWGTVASANITPDSSGIPYYDEARFLKRQNGCFFEINSSPDRLDLSAENARNAAAAEVMIAVSTDSHSTGELDLVRCGLDQARRAGLQKANILNGLPWNQLQRRFRR